jgi:hypothetical protein
MKIINSILVGVLILSSCSYAKSSDDEMLSSIANEAKDKKTKKQKSKIEAVIEKEGLDKKKEKRKIEDILKEDKEKEKKSKEKDKKVKLTLDEKRAILAEKKRKQKIIDEAKAEKIYQEALRDAINSVR